MRRTAIKHIRYAWSPNDDDFLKRLRHANPAVRFTDLAMMARKNQLQSRSLASIEARLLKLRLNRPDLTAVLQTQNIEFREKCLTELECKSI